MIHKIFSVHDQKAAAYLPPFYMPTKGMAVRLFKDCCNDPNHQFRAHPGDYTLVELGEFNDTSAQFDIHTIAITLGSGLEFKDTPELPRDEQ